MIDFLDVYWKTHHWPAFNVADSLICVGVGLLALDMFLEEKRLNSKSSNIYKHAACWMFKRPSGMIPAGRCCVWRMKLDLFQQLFHGFAQ